MDTDSPLTVTRTPLLEPRCEATYVPKVCAYLTRRDRSQLLVFRGPGYDGLQVPKGTVEPGESPEAALRREVTEESGLTVDHPRRVVSDVWTRRPGPLTKYVRHFYHAEVDESRDRWVHVVTGSGDERGQSFAYFWIDLPTDEPFALSLDDYLPAVRSDG
jgi:8-oxo-dGTP pyrophosphatase MutT (NUDIX family)